MIDFHCHLDEYPESTKVIEECCKESLHVLSMTNSPSEWYRANALIKDKPRLRIALGLHPQIINKNKETLDLFDGLIKSTKYVGEIGLDASTEHRQHIDRQIAAFDHILALCEQAGGKIMSIHSRGAAKIVLNSLKKYPDAGVPVLHWFSGSMLELKKAIEQGCWFSVGPAMFQSTKGRALVQGIPRDRFITETDGPFARFQGKILMPWHVSIVVKELSCLWKSSIEKVEGILSENIRCVLKAIEE